MGRFTKSFAWGLLLCVCFAAAAQLTTGTVTGTVTGAAVPGATIAVKNVETGPQRDSYFQGLAVGAQKRLGRGRCSSGSSTTSNPSTPSSRLTHGAGAMQKNFEMVIGRRFKRGGIRGSWRGTHDPLKLRLGGSLEADQLGSKPCISAALHWQMLETTLRDLGLTPQSGWA